MVQPSSSEPSFAWSVLRPADLLVLSFSFFNLVPEGDVGAALVRVDPEAPAHVVIDVGPQHVAESTVPQNPFPATQTTPPDPQPVPVPERHRMARRSRLAFRLPDDVTSVPFTLAALLDWGSWQPSLVPVADGPPPRDGAVPPLRAPGPTETSVELPYRLVLSPGPTGRWQHESTPRSSGSRSELWHTRLTTPPADPTAPSGPRELPQLRAVWSPDARPDPLPLPPEIATFPNLGGGGLAPADALSNVARHQIVHLSSNYALVDDNRRPKSATALPAEMMALSALGGWLRVHASFEPLPSEGFELVDWQHISTEARDHYVKQVHAGFLFPFGHRADLVQIAERKVVDTPAGPVAGLLSRSFIIVREPVRDYAGEGWMHSGREFPFSTVRITTLVTPDLAGPPRLVPGALSCKVAIQDTATAPPRPFPFHLVVTDVSGAVRDFTAGMYWIDKADPGNLPQLLPQAAFAYHVDEPYRASATQGQRLAYAPVPTAPAPGMSSPGDTRLATDTLRFTALLAGGRGFLPVLQNADVRVPAVEHLRGPGASTTMRPADAYLAHGLDDATNNAAGLFVQAVNPPLPVALPQKLSGGILNPDLALAGLSAHLGPVSGDLPNLANRVFDPKAVLGGAAVPKLFGAIDLWQLISSEFDLGQLPQTVTTQLPPTGAPTAHLTRLAWTPQVAGLPDAGLEAGPSFGLTVDAQVTTPLDGTAPAATVDATLTDFTFVLPPQDAAVIKVHFAKLSFHSQTGTKGDVSVELAGGEDAVEFSGVLSFLNELRKLIPGDGFSDPPAVSITDAGITTGYSVGLPPLPLAVFSLTDVRLGAQLELPFTAGKPRLRFAFCERDHPCMLTVSMLGGGAFLGIAVGLDGIEIIEAAVDFGGAFSLDIGVASGSVSVIAGIYFRYDEPAQRTELDGFLRINGAVDVLGLITVSVTFDLSFGYVSKPGGAIIQGEATLTVDVDLTLWSFSVSLSVHRSFGSGPGDPTFAALMPADTDWSGYAAAFAA
jgi:hypothetical protein